MDFRTDIVPFLRVALTGAIGFAFGRVLAVFGYEVGLAIGGILSDGTATLYADSSDVVGATSVHAGWGGLILVVGMALLLGFVYGGGHEFSAARLIVLWTTTHLAVLSFARLLGRDDTPLGDAINAFDLPDWVDPVIRWGSIVGMVLIGLAVGFALLHFTPKSGMTETRAQRLIFLGAAAAVPWLAGSLLVTFYSSSLVGGALVSGLVVVPMLLASFRGLEVEDVPTNIRWPVGPALLLAGAAVASRMVLEGGIQLPTF